MSYAVLAWWRAKPGHEGEVARLLLELTGPSRSESGCLEYRVHRNESDPTQFFLYELYLDAEAYQAHLDSRHFDEIARAQALLLLEDRKREFYVSLEGGSSGASTA